MNPISELINDARFVSDYRKRVMPIQKKLDRQAPKAGDLAPDFTLSDTSGAETVTLSQFRERQPAALVFGSFT